MAEATKYLPINGGTIITDLKSQMSFLKTKRSVTCAYAFVFVFIACTIFLAFSPSPNSSSPWFTNIFATSFSNASIITDESYRSHFSSVFSYFFPNSSSQLHFNSTSQTSLPTISRSPNNTLQQPNLNKPPIIVKNQTKSTDISDKVGTFSSNHSSTILAPKFNNTVNLASSKPSSVTSKDSSTVSKNQTTDASHIKGEVLEANQSTVVVAKSPATANRTVYSSPKPSPGDLTVPAKGDKNIAEKVGLKNVSSSSLNEKQSNIGTNAGASAKQGIEEMVKSLMNCNLYDGNWVTDESYPLYKPNSCSLIDEQFNCFNNGRPDSDYYKFKWKPRGCTLPRLNGLHMLELLRGKRLVFVGDSLNRNMWESLICILKNSVKNQKKVYEESGRHHFRGETSYAFIFEEYNCRVEFFVAPFLVEPWEVEGKDGKKKETLRLDLIGQAANKYKTADIIIFNTGHWWTHEKTSLGKDYYQEGSHVYSDLNVLEAFRKALTTWGRWVDANINPSRTHVMFRGYSESHFSGGQWNSGGACDHETQPIKNDTYLREYPSKMVVLEKIFRGMKTPVSYLNVTRMTDYRKDGHPSIYRKQYLTEMERRKPLLYQDCSHWCLPGVPDAWNELLYAEILLKHAQKHQL